MEKNFCYQELSDATFVHYSVLDSHDQRVNLHGHLLTNNYFVIALYTGRLVSKQGGLNAIYLALCLNK